MRGRPAERVPTMQDVQSIADDLLASRSPEQRDVFPNDVFDAMRAARLLSAGLVEGEGGGGWDLRMLVEAAEVLARRCGSTGLVWAMHQSQALTLAYETKSLGDGWAALRGRLARDQALVASAASELAAGSNFAKSEAVLVPSHGGGFSLEKRAATCSYGLHADAFLVSCRAPSASRATAITGDDVRIVFVARDQCDISEIGEWPSLGLRGTDSRPMTLTATVPGSQILPAPLQTVLARTMVPLAHVLWSGAWIGIAASAVEIARRRARRARSTNSTMVLHRLAVATSAISACRALVADAIDRHERLREKKDAMPLTAQKPFNDLKLTVSTACRDAVLDAMQIVGVSAYLDDAEDSLTRHVRDILAAPLMVNNLRLLEVQAALAPW